MRNYINKITCYTIGCSTTAKYSGTILTRLIAENMEVPAEEAQADFQLRLKKAAILKEYWGPNEREDGISMYLLER